MAEAHSLLPQSLSRAWAETAPPGGLGAVEHVVILMQENRSFDHYFGGLAGVRGYGDLNALQLSSGRSVFHQPDGDGFVLPYPTALENIDGTDHSARTGHHAYAQGRYDQWVPAKGPGTMVRYDRDSLEFYHQLAEAFTICDLYHCSVNGPTDPNRMYLFTGTVRNPLALENFAFDWQPKLFGSARRIRWMRRLPPRLLDLYSPHVREAIFGLSWTTYPERLERAGVSWQVYQEWDNYGDNSLEYFAPFRAAARAALQYTDAGRGVAFENFPYYYDVLRQRPERRPQLEAALRRGIDELPDYERQLVLRGLLREPEGTVVDRFRADVAAGRLPKVSWIVLPYRFSEHPSMGPRNGQAIVHELLDSICSDPEVWNSTVFLLNYDENDGYFDHIPPPVPPPGTPEEYFGSVPIGLGSRVPLLAVSPWSKQAVCSELFDHTSVLRFLERVTGVAEPNISPWRRAMCGDLTALLDFGRTAAPTLPAARAAAPQPENGVPQRVPTPQRLPEQDPGRRSRIPLPYRPRVTARQHPAAGTVTIVLGNEGTAATHYAIHPNAFTASSTPQLFDVGPGGTVIRELRAPSGYYDYTVYGADGFQRRFAGGLHRISGAWEVTATTAATADRQLTVTFRNEGSTAAAFVLHANAYRDDGPWPVEVPAGRCVDRLFTLDTEAAGAGWYDFTVTAPADPAFLRRMRGYAENGTPGLTAADAAPFDRLLLDRSVYEPGRDLIVHYSTKHPINRHRLAVYPDSGATTHTVPPSTPVRQVILPPGRTRDEVAVELPPSGSYLLHHLGDTDTALAQPIRFLVL
ncbi:phosphocholine-specific phospholipase C [Nocardia yamanashiensis]|uniref:phosphocholine-specific phospholipase C n=1 Tax=Nocardia yamanashiensis TaxID=209247 RepID=UPI0008342681|nr:phospholipase C, phosphocholine-specific [Nocardia yamanashiensis]